MIVICVLALAAGAGGFVGIQSIVVQKHRAKVAEVFGSSEMGTMVPFKSPSLIVWKGHGGFGTVTQFKVKWNGWGQSEATGSGTESSTSAADDSSDEGKPWPVSYKAWDVGRQCGVKAYRKLSVISEQGDVQTYQWGNAGPSGCGTFEQPCSTPRPNSFCS